MSELEDDGGGRLSGSETGLDDPLAVSPGAEVCSDDPLAVPELVPLPEYEVLPEPLTDSEVEESLRQEPDPIVILYVPPPPAEKWRM